MALSYEPHRSSAYSEDLRWRMVWQHLALGFSELRIAGNLGVDRSTVSRTIQLFLATGSVEKKNYPKHKAFRKLTTPVKLLILNSVVKWPGIYLQEIQEELINVLQVRVDISTICRFLHNNGFSRQRLRLVAIQRDDFLRQKYIMDVSMYNPDMFVFLDETGADRRHAIRKYGYSLRGIPLKKQTLLVRGEHVSGLAFMSLNGLLDVEIVKGVTTNGDVFYDFVQQFLLPQLMPFDGVKETVAMIQEVGAIVLFLPPYSPDMNPIEELFSKVKSNIKKLENMMDTWDIELIVQAAFASVTPQDCVGWISHCNIYNIYR